MFCLFLEMSRNRVWKAYNNVTYTEASRNLWTSNVDQNQYFLNWQNNDKFVNIRSKSDGVVIDLKEDAGVFINQCNFLFNKMKYTGYFLLLIILMIF